MLHIDILQGTIHPIPPDLSEALMSSPEIIPKRNNLTPLGRNERICRVTIVKQEKTRQSHILRLIHDIQQGKKRPCCWPGCPHHNTNTQKRF